MSSKLAHCRPAVAAVLELRHVRGDLLVNIEYALPGQRTDEDADDGLADRHQQMQCVGLHCARVLLGDKLAVVHTIHPSVSVAFMIAPTVVDSPSASRQLRSANGVMRRESGTARSDPREIVAVGKISAIWQNVQPTCSAVCQLSSVTGKGGRLAVEPITPRHSLCH